MKGLDVSHWQKGLNIGAITEAGYSFAILKITEGTGYADDTAPSFYMRAQEAGIPTGGYCYSHAVTPEQARKEAAFILEAIKGFPMPLGLYLDVEEQDQLALPHDELLAVVLAFCEKVRAAGYTPGVYGSEGTLWAKISPEELPEDVLIWAARYGREPDVPCDLWQSSDSGRIAGYDGSVDTDEARTMRFFGCVTSANSFYLTHKYGGIPNDPAGAPGESGVLHTDSEPVSDACPIFPPDPSVMIIQMVMQYNGYWGKPDGYKTTEFFSALRTFTDDMEKC